MPAEDLPLSNWTAAMNTCDEPVDGKPRWQAGFEVSVDDEPLDILGEIEKVACIQHAEIGGVWKIRVGGPGAPVWFHADEDLISTAEAVFEPHPGLDGTYNGVAASYPEPGQLWKPKDAPPRYNALWENADQGRRLVADLSLPACPWPDQVQRAMRAMIEEERRFRRHRHALPSEAEILEPLDAVAWTSAENGYDGKVFEIVETAEDLITGDVHVAVRERDAGDYDWQPEFTLPSTIAPVVVVEQDPVSPRGIQVEGIALEDAASIARRPAIRARWGTLGIEDATTIMWERRLGTVVVRGASADPGAGELVISEGILPETGYEVRLRFAGGQRDWQWTAWLPVTAPDVRLSMAELDAAARGAIEGALEWIDEFPDVEGAAIDQAIADARQLANDNLVTAKTYADDGIHDEALLRADADLVLSGQVETIAASLGDQPGATIIVNGDFATSHTDGWSGNTGGGNFMHVARDPASGSPLIKFAPTPMFANLPRNTNNPRQVYQKRDFPAAADQRMRFRVWLGTTGVIAPELRIAWFTGATQIGTEEQIALSLPLDEWDEIILTREPPAAANSVRLTIWRPGGDGNFPLYIADVYAGLLGDSIFARVQQAEAAITTTAEAVATLDSTLTARMGTAEAAITAEQTARSDADTALANRATALETTTGNHGARITSAETTITTQSASVAQLQLLALSSTASIIDGRASPALLPYGTQAIGTVADYTPLAAAGYGRDADGAYLSRSSAGAGAGVYLRATVPSEDSAVYRVSIRVKPMADLTLRMRVRWMTPDGVSAGQGTLHVTPMLAADGIQTMTMIIGRYAGGIVDTVAGGTAWTNGTMIRFGIDNLEGVAGASYRVYEIRVDDVTRIDQEARARAGADTALATRATALETRMGTAEAAITAEQTARSTADTALANRATALETTTGNHAGRLTTAETAISTTTGSLAALATRVEASGGMSDLVGDPTFAGSFADWPVGPMDSAGARFEARNLGSGNWVYNAMPAARALRITTADMSASPTQWRGTAYQPVTPGEEIAVSYSYARASNGIQPAAYVRFRNAAGTVLATVLEVKGTGSGSWLAATGSITVPAGAVEAQAYVIGTGSGWVNNCWVTNFRAPRGQEAYASGTLKIETVVDAGGAVATLGLGVRAGGIETGAGQASVFLRAGSNGVSELLCNAAAFYLYDPSSETAPFAYVDGELYLNARVTAQYLEIDRLLTFSGTGALSAFKASPDDSTDGLFFGRVDEGGTPRFALSASRTGTGDRVQEVSFTSDGFKLVNPAIMVRSSALDPQVRVTANLAATSLAGAKMVRVPSAIGGGGGGGGGTAGGNGGATIVRLYDGATLKHTVTAPGGLGSNGPINGIGVAGLDPGNRGGGGNGGKYLDLNGNNKQGRGGARGGIVSRDWIDISTWADPKITVDIGAGGAANNTDTITILATSGTAGAAIYQTMSGADIRADAVPSRPSGKGTFSKGNSAAGTFPDLGPGMWLIQTTDNSDLNMGNIDITDADQILGRGPALTFVADRTPAYSGGSGAKTIRYTFWSMGGDKG